MELPVNPAQTFPVSTFPAPHFFVFLGWNVFDFLTIHAQIFWPPLIEIKNLIFIVESAVSQYVRKDIVRAPNEG